MWHMHSLPRPANTKHLYNICTTPVMQCDHYRLRCGTCIHCRAQQTQNICITFVQRRSCSVITTVYDVAHAFIAAPSKHKTLYSICTTPVMQCDHYRLRCGTCIHCRAQQTQTLYNICTTPVEPGCISAKT